MQNPTQSVDDEKEIHRLRIFWDKGTNSYIKIWTYLNVYIHEVLKIEK